MIAICKEDNTNIYDYGVISQTDILCQLDSLGSQTWESGGKGILEDGNSYYLAFFYKWHGEWYMEARSQAFKVNKFKPVTEFDVEQITFNGSLLTLEPVSTEITITNKGNVTNGILYIFVDNTLTNLIRINALAIGQTAKYTIKLTPQTTGINTVVITLDAEGNSPSARTTSTIPLRFRRQIRYDLTTTTTCKVAKSVHGQTAIRERESTSFEAERYITNDVDSQRASTPHIIFSRRVLK